MEASQHSENTNLIQSHEPSQSPQSSQRAENESAAPENESESESAAPENESESESAAPENESESKSAAPENESESESAAPENESESGASENESSTPNPSSQAIIPYRTRRTRANEAEYTEMVRWCIEHVNIYQGNSRSAFWADLGAFMMENLKLEVKYPA